MEVEQSYSNIVTMIEGLLEFHPEYYDLATNADKEVMGLYYFFGRSIDVEDIQAYRVASVIENPHLQLSAQSALGRWLRAINMPGDPAQPSDWV